MASNAENVSIWWRHHAIGFLVRKIAADWIILRIQFKVKRLGRVSYESKFLAFFYFWIRVCESIKTGCLPIIFCDIVSIHSEFTKKPSIMEVHHVFKFWKINMWSFGLFPNCQFGRSISLSLPLPLSLSPSFHPSIHPPIHPSIYILYTYMKLRSYPKKRSHCGRKLILRPSYFPNGILCTGKTSSYWIRLQSLSSHALNHNSWLQQWLIRWCFLLGFRIKLGNCCLESPRTALGLIMERLDWQLARHSILLLLPRLCCIGAKTLVKDAG